MIQKDLKEYQDAVKVARQELAQAKALDKKMSEKALAADTYIDEETKERITSKDFDYTMSEFDFLERYLPARRAFFLQAGINQPIDYCYINPFEKALKEAENNLLDVCTLILPAAKDVITDFRNHYKTRIALVDMALKLSI